MRSLLTYGLLLCLLLGLLPSCGPSALDTEPEPAVAHKGIRNAPYKVRGKRYVPLSVEEALKYDQTGIASWYGRGKKRERTALGEYMNSASSISAAHCLLPLPCTVKITCVQTGAFVIARVNDRGPFTKNRLIDVSPKIAQDLNLKSRGVGQVRVQVLSVGDGPYKRKAS